MCALGASTRWCSRPPPPAQRHDSTSPSGPPLLVEEELYRGEVMAERHCPATEMVADFSTKPPQGATLKELRGQILDVVSCWSCGAPNGERM